MNILSYSLEDIRRGKQRLAAVIEEFRGVRDVLGIPRLRPQLTEGGAQPFGLLSQITGKMRAQPSREEMYEETAEQPVQTQEVRPAEILKKKIPFLGQQERTTPLIDLIKQKTIRSAVKNIITGYTSAVGTQPQEEEEKKPGDEYEEKRRRKLELMRHPSASVAPLT